MALWVDKYRPRDLSKLDYHVEQANDLKRLCEQQDFPHLMFFGPSGAGKKTRIMCILRELYGTSAERLRSETMTFTTPSNRKIEIMTVSSNYHIEGEIKISQFSRILKIIFNNFSKSIGCWNLRPHRHHRHHQTDCADKRHGSQRPARVSGDCLVGSRRAYEGRPARAEKDDGEVRRYLPPHLMRQLHLAGHSCYQVPLPRHSSGCAVGRRNRQDFERKLGFPLIRSWCLLPSTSVHLPEGESPAARRARHQHRSEV